MFETFIINPFITIMTALYGLLGNNIVLAIALFTVIIRLATSPLLIKQQQSTKAMQEIQPKLKKLQEKYKNDREKLAQVQMELYREHGVNPLSGCLPLFIQLPVLLALYQAIIYALAATPFQLIDLSSRLVLPGLDSLVPLQNMWLGMDLTLPPTVNPTYALIFPALVFVTSWLQTKLIMPTPTNVDPNDQTAQVTRTMSTMMPIMFAMFALSFSVGLSIYFVVGNLVSIAQYTFMGKAEWRKLFGGKKEEETAPAVVTSKATTVTSEDQPQTKAEKRKNKKMRARNS